MQRREFLEQSIYAAAAVSLCPAACSVSDQDAAAGSDATIDHLEAHIPRLMKEAQVPGLSVALIKEGKLYWRRGFGVKDVSSREPVDIDTLFEAASTSKPVFAYAVMKLCETGVMELDTPLSTYANERFLEDDPRLDLITTRHVLSHTSGLPNFRRGEAPLAIHFTPGSRWSYSGEGYSYLQSVVSALVGARVNRKDCAKFEADMEVCAVEPSIDDFMRQRVLMPFGMSASGYLWTNDMEARMARGHNEKAEPLDRRRQPTRPSLARYGMLGGLCTTATDYAKFVIEILDAKPADDYRLNTRSLNEMLRPQVTRNVESSWALGWEINHTPIGNFVRHGGGNPGFQCLVAASVQRKSGFVVMTNSENGYYGVISKLITGDSLPHLLGGKLRPASE
jgi:CubicO group peptidase (beta-lactamase class C family)